MFRMTRTGSFELALKPDDAVGLFTAEGERAWIPGWVPIYPQVGAVHDAVGTVFLREDESGDMTFVVVDSGPGLRRRYARIAEGLTAGIVDVVCTPSQAGTRVDVTFDLTALSPRGEAWIAELDGGYAGMITLWRDWIVATVPGAAV
jgi:hypothetical protein